MRAEAWLTTDGWPVLSMTVRYRSGEYPGWRMKGQVQVGWARIYTDTGYYRLPMLHKGE